MLLISIFILKTFDILPLKELGFIYGLIFACIVTFETASGSLTGSTSATGSSTVSNESEWTTGSFSGVYTEFDIFLINHVNPISLYRIFVSLFFSNLHL